MPSSDTFQYQYSDEFVDNPGKPIGVDQKMNMQDPISAADLDKNNYMSARDGSHKDLLVYAARKSGRSVLKIQREFDRMAKSHSRLNMVEYVRHGLYMHDNFSDEQRAAYISNDLHWEITHRCNNQSWTGVAEDKALATMLLSSADIPVPPILGVIDTSPRRYPGLPKVEKADQLRDLVMANLGKGIFGKIVDGMVSFGAFRIEDADADVIKCSGHSPMKYDTFLSDFVGSNAYVLQPQLENHPDIAPFASALATVRMVNMVTENGVYSPLAIIKLPQGSNIADAFWRSGNIAAEVDITTGVIRTVAERIGPEVTFHSDHPHLPGLMGSALPYWDKLLEINARAAEVFAPIRYQSTDIAITETGPIIIELNYGGGFDLPQYASGRGMLTPEVRAFFELNGYSFEAPAQKKRSFFGRS